MKLFDFFRKKAKRKKPKPDPLWLTIRQVADQTGFSVTTIRRNWAKFGFHKVLGTYKTHQHNVTSVMSGRDLSGDARRKQKALIREEQSSDERLV